MKCGCGILTKRALHLHSLGEDSSAAAAAQDAVSGTCGDVSCLIIACGTLSMLCYAQKDVPAAVAAFASITPARLEEVRSSVKDLPRLRTVSVMRALNNLAALRSAACIPKSESIFSLLSEFSETLSLHSQLEFNRQIAARHCRQHPSTLSKDEIRLRSEQYFLFTVRETTSKDAVHKTSTLVPHPPTTTKSEGIPKTTLSVFGPALPSTASDSDLFRDYCDELCRQRKPVYATVSREFIVADFAHFWQLRAVEEVLSPLHLSIESETAIDGGLGGVSNEVFSEFFRSAFASLATVDEVAGFELPAAVSRAIGCCLFKCVLDCRAVHWTLPKLLFRLCIEDFPSGEEISLSALWLSAEALDPEFSRGLRAFSSIATRKHVIFRSWMGHQLTIQTVNALFESDCAIL